VDGVSATFGFVDLAGFTALIEVHGDAEAVTMLDRFAATATDSLGGSGRLVKTIGDALMLAFDEPTAAVTAVVSMFEAMQDTELPVARCGLHHGTALERNSDYFGAAVNLTARIAGQAHGGQVLGTTVVAQAARATGVPVTALGRFNLRNIAEPVELFQLEIGGETGATAVDPICRMQVPRASAAGRLRHRDRQYWFCSLECARIFTADPDRAGEATS
jgi:adenylate cyclase